MRIIAGQFKNRRLLTPDDRSVRPTGSRTREALFNLLMHGHYAGENIVGQPVADICCGTGALGLEALSRGATSCIFLDRDVTLARKNAEAMIGRDQGSEVRGQGRKSEGMHTMEREAIQGIAHEVRGGMGAALPRTPTNTLFLPADAAHLPAAPHPVACVFIDAPYDSAFLRGTLTQLCERNWLLPEALVCVEQGKNEKIHEVSGLDLLDSRAYGKAGLRIYRAA